jgi:hypothetical protein
LTKGGEPVAEPKQAEFSRPPRTFRNKSCSAFSEAFDRIHDISKYIKIRKEIIKMAHISRTPVARPTRHDTEAIDIEGVARKAV